MLRRHRASGQDSGQQQGAHDADCFHSLFLTHRIVAVAGLFTGGTAIRGLI